MQERTAPEWSRRAHRLGIKFRVIAQATGKSYRTVQAYRSGQIVPTPEWLEKVDALLSTVEDAIDQGSVA